MKKHRKSLGTFDFKVAIVGNFGTGKTSLVTRFIKGVFNDVYEETIGASYLKKEIPYGDYTVSFHIWDTAGGERYRALAPMYYRDATVILIFYDQGCADSIYFAKRELDSIKSHIQNTPTLILVGNKLDLEAKINYDEMIELSNSFGCIHTQISVKTSQNFKELFEIVANSCVRGMN